MESVLYYLTSEQKRKAIWLSLLLIFSSLLDVLGLASLVPVMMVAAEPGGIQKSRIFAPVYQSLHFHSEHQFLLSLIGFLFLFFLVKNLFSTWVNHLQVVFTASIGLAIVRNQLTKYLHFPFWHFNHLGSAKLINSTLEVPMHYVVQIVRPLLILLSEAVIVLVIILGILFYKPLLFGLLAVVLVPPTLIIYRTLRVRAQAIGARFNALRPATFAILGDLFAGFAELKLAGKHASFRDKLLKTQSEVQHLDAKSYLYSLLPVKVIEMVAILGVLTIFLYAILVPSASNELITLVGLFAAAAYRLMPSVNRILQAMVQIKFSQFSIEDLAAYRGPEFDEAPHAQQLPLRFEHSLEFKNICFSFPGSDELTLRGINLRIRKGEKIGFIGSSGSGKTTLMNVLLRFYTEQQGQILLDEQPLTNQHLEAWHGIIGYVKQDTFLMEATIQDNITLGDVEIDEERLNYAVEQASLRTFIASLPEGLQAHIGERGSKLSGGQRQRIGIARALYKQTQVLVLDEATSALDNETEREVNEAINKLSQTDITILIIAHRITTLRECDRIYELSQGKVVAEHQYQTLVQH